MSRGGLARWQAALLGAASFAFATAAVAQAYPVRPVNLIVPWNVGGGTDATARIIASALQKELKQPVNVVNRTGGSGVVGHQAIASAPADGYTIGLITVEITMMHWTGLSQLKHSDFTPIALVTSDPAGVSVRADAPYSSVRDLLAAVKANPGKLRASGTEQGGIWHLALAGMLKDQGVAPSAISWIPSQGAAAGLKDLVAGALEIVTCSIPEARRLIDAGKVKPLVVMGGHPPALYPDLPTLRKELGSHWESGAWGVVAGPKELPANVQARLVEALKKVHDSKDFQDFMAQRGSGVIWAGPEETAQLMMKSDADNGAIMKAVRIAK